MQMACLQTRCAGTRAAQNARSSRRTATAARARPSTLAQQQHNRGGPASTSSNSGSNPLESPTDSLTRRLIAVTQPGEGRLLLLAAALVGTAALGAAPAAAAQEYHQHTHQLLAELAEGDTGFWANVLRYISYFFSVLLGTAYVALKPLADLFRRPTTALLALGGIAGLLAFVSFTVNAMLGVNEPFEYNP